MRNVSVAMNENDFNVLDRMAKESHKSRSEIMREALKTKSAYDEYVREAVVKGRESADKDELISHGDVVAHMGKIRDELS